MLRRLKPLADRREIESAGLDNLRDEISFAHTFNRHQEDPFQCLIIECAAVLPLATLDKHSFNAFHDCRFIYRLLSNLRADKSATTMGGSKLLFITASHQRSNRDPATAPTAAGISMPSRYQTPMNGASISGQCNA